jgi:hypothetical protein
MLANLGLSTSEVPFVRLLWFAFLAFFVVCTGIFLVFGFVTVDFFSVYEIMLVIEQR